MAALEKNGRFEGQCEIKRKDGVKVSAQISVNLTEVAEDIKIISRSHYKCYS